MKRRKILVLIPVLGLFLSGCTFQEGFGMVKNWIGDNVYRPAKEWIENITGKGGEKEEPTPEPEPQPQPQPQPQPSDVKYGTLEAPLSLSEFQTNVEKVIDYSTVEEDKTKTYSETPFFVKGRVFSNEAASNGKIRFTNLVDSSNGSIAVTGYYLVFGSGVDSATYGAAGAMFGKEVVVKGYGMLYNKGGTKVYEIGEQSQEGEKGQILSVTTLEPTAGTNYGTLAEPLTTSQANTLLDGEMPSKGKMYVTGVVKSNTAWSTDYKNVDIVISDGSKDFTIYRTSTFPTGYNKEGIAKDGLKDLHVVASGYGKIYGETYEFEQGCVVEQVEGYTVKTISGVTNVEGPSSVSLNGEVLPSQFTVTVSYAEGGSGTAVVTAVNVDTSTAGTANGTLTIEGWSEPVPFTITVEAEANPFKDAYEAGEALDDKSSGTKQYTFSGVVVGTRGTDDYFIQNGSYGIDLFKPGTVEGLAHGKQVTVTSVMKKYNGVIETGDSPTVVVGEAASSMPNAVVIDSAATLASTKQNVLVNITGVCMTDVTSASGDVTINLTVGTDTIAVYFKSSIRSTEGLAALNSLRKGDTVTLTNAVKSVFKTTNQVLPVAETTVSVTKRTITGIASVAGPTETIALNGTIANSDVTVMVNVQGLSEPVPGYVTSVSAVTTTGGENLHGTVMIDGWSEPIDFTYSVASAPAEPVEKTYIFAEIDFTSWSTSYAARTVSYTECDVNFEAASKQAKGSTIDNVPVVKNKYVEVVAKSGRKILAASFTFTQWASKTQTMTMYYSTDGGETYSSFEPALKVSDFSALSCSSLPSGTNAVKIVGSEDKQIGINGGTFTFQ